VATGEQDHKRMVVEHAKFSSAFLKAMLQENFRKSFA
jgi:hypothetical protein